MLCRGATRTHRMSMVQTAEQYEFLYRVLVDSLTAPKLRWQPSVEPTPAPRRGPKSAPPPPPPAKDDENAPPLPTKMRSLDARAAEGAYDTLMPAEVEQHMAAGAYGAGASIDVAFEEPISQEEPVRPMEVADSDDSDSALAC